MNDLRYWLAVLLVSMMPPALIWWVLVHPFTAFWRRVGRRTTLVLLTGGATGTVAVLIALRDRILLTDLGTSWATMAAAVPLLVLSARIAILRKRHLTTRIMAGVPELEGGGSVLTEGIYGVVRHPRYLEVAIGTIGYALIANHLGSYLVAAATLPAIHGIVLLEERELRARFGAAYAEYAMRVPRYMPGSVTDLVRGARS